MRIGIEEPLAKSVSLREDLFPQGEFLCLEVLAQKLTQTYLVRLKNTKPIKAGFRNLMKQGSNP